MILLPLCLGSSRRSVTDNELVRFTNEDELQVEGEGCQESFFRGVIPLGKCDTGLECVKQKHVAFGRGVCAKKERKRAALTRCELMKRQNMMIMVVWSGQWVGPNCDANGNFLPEQCDRSGHCFCVTQNGDVIKNTKVLGHAKC
ncbi:uncharacterized protein LOC121381512 isoform X2 [Gigantopelta aegis]|uniref:uncharacterized protein LOC121381512 isoform X2 n=1 Tax=Gigantopelta aegis TaxID=1735272 RepID=UPI001B88A3BB|nr:uncharacterized protein LOC121381512 isoform X2 [Gigantopelta aegis]